MAEASSANPPVFVSRAGLKLAHALDVFALDVAGRRCADFGCNVGGFTDCLLQRGATSVVSIDTGYGTLAWKLRKDPRVLVRERCNALHTRPNSDLDRVEVVVIDMGWTPQRLCIPAALHWLRPGDESRIITLIKPHYETTPEEKSALQNGVLPRETAETIVRRVQTSWTSLQVESLGLTESPLEGGGGKGNASGNHEWLAVLRRITSTTPTDRP